MKGGDAGHQRIFVFHMTHERILQLLGQIGLGETTAVQSPHLVEVSSLVNLVANSLIGAPLEVFGI